MNASIGLAANRFTAGAAAAAANTSTLRLVRPGEEAAFLAPLSVETVALEPETARRLDLFGLRQLGQIAVMPSGSRRRSSAPGSSSSRRWMTDLFWKRCWDRWLPLLQSD